MKNRDCGYCHTSSTNAKFVNSTTGAYIFDQCLGCTLQSNFTHANSSLLIAHLHLEKAPEHMPNTSHYCGLTRWSEFKSRVVTSKGRLEVGSFPTLRTLIHQQTHGTPVGGHSGSERTYERVVRSFYDKKMEQVYKVVADCEMWAKETKLKSETIPMPGYSNPYQFLMG